MNLLMMLLLVAWILVCVWFMVCTQRASTQRKRLMEATRYAPTPDVSLGYLLEISSVDFGDHVARLVFFRDALAVYSPGLRSLYWRARAAA